MSDAKRAAQPPSRSNRKRTRRGKSEEGTEIAKRDRSKNTDTEMLSDAPVDSTGEEDNIGNKTMASESRTESLPVLDTPRRDEEQDGTDRSPSPAQNVANNRPQPQPQSKPHEEYLFQVYYDKQNRHYHVSVAEFPELRVTASQKDQAVQTMENRLNQHLQSLKKRGESVPEPISAKRFPEKLELSVSQSLFRKLDILSRQEKIPLDQLVVEVLTAGVERRQEHRKPQQPRPQQNDNRGNTHNHGNSNRHNNHNNHNRRGANQGRFHDTMNNRENFIDYVRNLEKGGGNWRKK